MATPMLDMVVYLARIGACAERVRSGAYARRSEQKGTRYVQQGKRGGRVICTQMDAVASVQYETKGEGRGRMEHTHMDETKG